MALKKDYTTPTGALCSYHRVDNIEIDVATRCGRLIVGHYRSEDEARVSRTPAWVTEFGDFTVLFLENAREEAYAVIKAVPFWSDAADS